MNTTSFQIREVEVKGYALLSGYLCTEKSTVDIESDPLDVNLFCVKQGQVRLHVPFIPHPIELCSGEAIFLAFPKSEWPTKIQAEASSEFFMMRMGVATLHKLIQPSFDEQHLDQAHRVNMRDLMRLIPISPSTINCFEQLLHHKISSPFDAIFERAKFLEIFSLLMESSFGHPMESCPVSMSPAIEMKLGQVRRYIMEHVDETPDPDALAMMYELPRNTLREGYRFVYGKTIHQFHADHKLESAMQMLHSGELLVKEVAFKIGYQNPSHFISAFKKKYGHTPKQYFRRESVVKL